MNDIEREIAYTEARKCFAFLVETLKGETLREGLRDTSHRAARAWQEKTRGYAEDPKDVLKMFTIDKTVRGMVLVRDIEIESLCEHHLERIWGYAHIAYVPDDRILGLSKFQRLCEIYARRLQVQERLTAQIADAIMSGIEPKGVGVVIEARHACIEARGVCKRGQVTVTSELRGVFYDDAATRSEFLNLAKTTKVF